MPSEESSHRADVFRRWRIVFIMHREYFFDSTSLPRLREDRFEPYADIVSNAHKP
ncbi:MAG: hypothetical protein ACXADF_19385 [Candidatus Thorarchaeota archaeon]